jgi:transcription antitermination factor NusG
MLALSENPPMMSQDIGSLLDIEGDWWVAHTKARCEKALAWDLHAGNIPWFLPMVERTAVWGGRKRKVLNALFPLYVFFCGDQDDRQTVLRTGRVCQVIAVPQREKFVGELDAIHRTLASKGDLAPYPFAAVGRRCRIARGPLKGIEGVVVRNHDSTRIVLEVSMLGQGASLEIDGELLDPVE